MLQSVVTTKDSRGKNGDLMEFLYPNKYVKKVADIDFEALYAEGFEGVLFDVDNTLVPFDQLDAHDELIDFIENLQNIGFSIGLVSNNSRKRVEALNVKLGLEIMPNAMKPLTHRLRKVLNTLNIQHKKGIFVGDQLFTDVWVGNRLGLYTVLVKPIQAKEQVVTKIKRRTEKLVLNRYLKKEGLSYDD